MITASRCGQPFKTSPQVSLEQHQGRQIIHRSGRQPQTCRAAAAANLGPATTANSAHALPRCCPPPAAVPPQRLAPAQPRPGAMGRWRCHHPAPRLAMGLGVASAATNPKPPWGSKSADPPAPFRWHRCEPARTSGALDPALPKPPLMKGLSPWRAPLQQWDPSCRCRAQPPPPNAPVGCLCAPPTGRPKH